jgi:protein-S-isoprenylcysteine O-methyltransferase Ste14
MQRILAVGYALVAYLIFFATFLWLVAFLANLPMAPTIVDGTGSGQPPAAAILFDVVLIALFGVQHSIMARPSFKAMWTRIVPASVERATYVVAASAALAALLWFWQPIGGTVWDLRGTAVEPILWTVFAIGWVVLFISTWLINHSELFGLMQAWQHGRPANDLAPVLRQPLFYRYVRHPLYLGFSIAFWSAPFMSWGHLLFTVGMQAYILIGIAHEERDLVMHFGPAYEDYRRKVGMLLPGIGRRRSAAS